MIDTCVRKIGDSCPERHLVIFIVDLKKASRRV